MQNIVVIGKVAFRLRLWELLQLQGILCDCAFVDPDPAPLDRGMLGKRVQSVDWLIRNRCEWKQVVLESVFSDLQDDLIAAGWQGKDILIAPRTTDRDQLLRWLQQLLPDPYVGILQAYKPLPPSYLVGVFGAGDGGRKVWEAATTYDCYQAAWFADNDFRRQGGAFFGLEVIDPNSIPGRYFTAIIIGSIYRVPIGEQLLALGLEPQQIIAPDIDAPLFEVHTEIKKALDKRFAKSIPGDTC